MPYLMPRADGIGAGWIHENLYTDTHFVRGKPVVPAVRCIVSYLLLLYSFRVQ